MMEIYNPLHKIFQDWSETPTDRLGNTFERTAVTRGGLEEVNPPTSHL